MNTNEVRGNHQLGQPSTDDNDPGPVLDSDDLHCACRYWGARNRGAAHTWLHPRAWRAGKREFDEKHNQK